MSAEIKPSAIRELLDYNPETGVLTWKPREVKWFEGDRRHRECKRWNGRYAGKPALTALHTHKSYRSGKVLGQRFLAHRVAWAHFYGAWPKGQIDHIAGTSGKVSDDRIQNLRDVTATENQRNQRRHKDNQSGVTGVYWHKATKKWASQIRVSGKCLHLGTFSDFGGAVAARKRAERTHGFALRHGVAT